MFGLGIVDAVKIGAGVIVGGFLAYHAGHWRGEANGRALEQAAARSRAMELIQKRSKDDAEISTMDAARLCRELGGQWVPNENRCD